LDYFGSTGFDWTGYIKNSIEKNMFERINQEHPVIVLGLGLTGASCVNYCQRKGWPVLVMDSREQPPQLNDFKASHVEIEVLCGDFDENKLATAGLIIISPGVDFGHPALAKAKATQVPIVGDIELFAQENRVPIIAVTGSNGKSTVCDCLGWMFNHLGIDTIVAGNIGTPVLDLLQQPKPDLYVLELSSFQIETTQSLNAKVVSVLNISEDHLDRHGNMDNYVSIKQKLYTMAQAAAVNLDDPVTHCSQIPEQRLTFGSHSDADFKVTQEQNKFSIYHQHQVLLSESECQIAGFHNGLNLAACLAMAKLYGLLINERLLDVLRQYSGLEYRCQQVPTNDGVRWINDSKATNVGAAKAAIYSFAGQGGHLYLIAGGDAKGGDISQLSDDIQRFVTFSWVYGKDAELFLNVLPKTICQRVSDLTEAVYLAKQMAKSGDTVLFSPACASLDMYPNYKVRGEHFNQLVGGVQ
jgi:UDP-N-acetylmuramoylalanine--D-glutamate ligase